MIVFFTDEGPQALLFLWISYNSFTVLFEAAKWPSYSFYPSISGRFVFAFAFCCKNSLFIINSAKAVMLSLVSVCLFVYEQDYAKF